MTAYTLGGPPRYSYQRRGLRKLIDTRGVTALLFDPGMGKTATVIDYVGLLAVKQQREVRVLVTCPLAAVDTWVLQMRTFASPQVSWWAEAIGGTIAQRCEFLTDRGRTTGLRSLGTKRAHAWDAQRTDGVTVLHQQGPGALGEGTHPRVVLCVVNLDTFSQKGGGQGGKLVQDEVHRAVKKFAPDVLVVDESHKIKGAASNVSRMFARLGRLVPRRIILTGTVMPHSPMDVYAQWRFLAPTEFGEKMIDGTCKAATLGGFRARYAIMGGWMGHEVKSWHRLDEMQAIMSRHAVVARKDEALDLPPTTEVIVPVNLSPTEAATYRDMKKTLAAQLANGQLVTAPNRLAQMTRLRQITAGHLPDDKGAIQRIGESKARTVVSLVKDTLTSERRIVIFAMFTHEIDTLCRLLATSRDLEVQRIDGGTSTAARRAMRERFGSDDPARLVMVAQIKTMSLAVNELVSASHAIFASLSWQRDDHVQAQDRLNRIGQTRPVTFWYVLAPGTVDDIMHAAHQTRTNVEDAVLSHIRDAATTVIPA